jgi:hypothetical protein
MKFLISLLASAMLAAYMVFAMGVDTIDKHGFWIGLLIWLGFWILVNVYNALIEYSENY